MGNNGKPRIVHNRVLGGWYVVRGPHQAPLGGRHNSKAEAQQWLADQAAARDARSAKLAEDRARNRPGYQWKEA